MGRQEEAAPDFLENGKRWDGYRPVEYPVLEALCRAIDENRHQLFVASFGNIGRYIGERNAAKIQILKETENEVVLKLTHSLDPGIFDMPLTLKMTLESTAEISRVVQDVKTVDVITRGREWIFDVVPNGGVVTIRID